MIRMEVITGVCRSHKYSSGEIVTATISETQASMSSDVAVTFNPAGADIEVDGAFVGDTPSTITVAAGNHTISLKKPGFTPWERKVKVSGSNIYITAELQASGETPTPPGQ